MIDKDFYKKLIFKKLQEISSEIIQNELVTISLMEGVPGSIMFCDGYYSLTGQSKVLHARNEYLRRLLDLLENIEDFSLSYCDGLVGSLSFIRLFSFKNNLNIYDFDQELDDYLFEVMTDNISNGKYDFLHGGMGIFWYYVLRIKTSSDVIEKQRLINYLERGLQILDDVAIRTKDGYSWKTTITNPGSINEEIFNMGFAHGQPGILTAVSIASLELDSNKTAKRIIKESSNFILLRANEENQTQFQSYFSAARQFPFDSRLGWCYGDLSASIALRFAGNSLKSKELQDRSEKIAIRSTSRNSVAETSVFDGGLCHGSAGLSHMYGRFHDFTANVVFKEAQIFWMKKTLELGTSTDGIAGFRTHVRDDSWGKDFGLLKGVAGIGLAMISFINSDKNWDKLLMLR